MEIQDVFNNLWRRKWVVLITLVVGALVTLFFLQFREETFKSTARISTGYTITDQVDLNEPSERMRDQDVRFNNLLELMKSPVSFNLLSYRLLLHDLNHDQEQTFRYPKDPSVILEEDRFTRMGKQLNAKMRALTSDYQPSLYSFFEDAEIELVKKEVKEKLRAHEALDPSDPNFDLIRKFLLAFGYDYQAVSDALNIYRVFGTDYINVEFESHDRELSAFAANTFSKEFIDYYATIRGEHSNESVAFLKEVAAERKAILDNKLSQLEGYGVSDAMGEGERASRYSQLVDLERRRDELRSAVQEHRLTINQLEQDVSGSGGGSQQNQRVVALQDQIRALQRRYVSTGSTNRELSDSLAYLRGRLRSLIARLDTDTETVGTSDLEQQLKTARIDYQVAQNDLQQVNARINQLQYGFSNDEEQSDEVAALKNEIEVAKQDYNEVLRKLNQAKNQQVTESSLRQVLAATPALNPSSMKSIYVLCISVFSCFALAVLVIILGMITDDTIRTPYRFQKMVNLKLQAVLNKVSLKKLDFHKIFISEYSPKREVEFYKSSLRHLRYQIEGMNSKIFLFTSLRPGAGKTSIINSLAYVFSLLKKRVLIIDTNFKNNSLTQIYGSGLKEVKVVQKRMVSKRSPRMAKVTANGAGAEDEELVEMKSSLDLVNPTDYDDIFFVGNSGITGNSPSEMLSRRDFKKFVLMMAEQFDYIFLEGPALNDHSDSRELVSFVQRVVTVVNAQDTVRPVDEQSIEFVKSLKGKSAGAVLNQVVLEDIRD
ncbi:GumC family protein [Marinoscillum furvescens]|uniref:Uncharacterized protein involved in exopolysaccharide biosynthesis n=1 Tax=Marinoscillum furvescens DSM 4134 TaxID=1122208 RepID=A0A3D9L2K1_MARFU|nr:hypothetical protein [Marinoscillum furvescens]RED95654.1 uncharacterized protein involved in exopolysaccharide biosynthesis [Marinoscillum furvescens DSM 4134]